MVEEGKPAPQFELATDAGGKVSLAALKGRPVVVYFYPKDDTSGCTAEAKAFTEKLTEFKTLGAEVIGISPDSATSHKKFRTKHDLGHVLAADEDTSVATRYGVWVEKSMYGRKYMGVERSTFLIDPAGRVAKAWRKVKVPGHADEVLEALRGMAGDASGKAKAKLAKAKP
jgi:peroxiredoxin Q/BCP